MAESLLQNIEPWSGQASGTLDVVNDGGGAMQEVGSDDEHPLYPGASVMVAEAEQQRGLGLNNSPPSQSPSPAGAEYMLDYSSTSSGSLQFTRSQGSPIPFDMAPEGEDAGGAAPMDGVRTQDCYSASPTPTPGANSMPSFKGRGGR
jgi:hypothetical protein